MDYTCPRCHTTWKGLSAEALTWVKEQPCPEQPTTAVPVEISTMRSALADATCWADPKMGSERHEYWRGMRDTLRVMLGITTVQPTETGPDTDVAAFLLLQGR